MEPGTDIIFSMLHYFCNFRIGELIMKKIIAALVLFIFAAGFIAIPAVHSMHCDEAGHSGGACPICAAASMTLQTPNVFIAPILNEAVAENTPPLILLKTEFFIYRTHPARAPPVA
jgi:hypothetical protein